MTRRLACLLALLALPLSALAQQSYDVTATMAVTTGTPEGCVLYLDSMPVDDPATPALCGQPVTYPQLITGDGTYEFAYTLVDGGTETLLSPVTTVQITTEVTDPTEPPVVTIECVDSTGAPITCPSAITITVN